ncbi:MAG: hypothetical protein ABR562_03825 [Thermoplasmatota archaeon]|nr:hypothetical protein [Halobacteriales archaeon]
MPETLQAPDNSLQPFLSSLAPDAGLRLRTLAHAWQGGGGGLYVGRLALRLLAPDGTGRTFTAGTLHVAHGEPPKPSLELGRILLQSHGIGAAAWREWCDERPDLRVHGFDGDAKFPVVRLDSLPDAALARLASGLRDLARLVQR